MSKEKTYTTRCPQHEHAVYCHSEDCSKNGCAEKRQELKARAEQQWQRAIAVIEQLPDHQQEKVIECGMRMRELACYYGPYFTQALMLTSAEIGAGRLLMPKVANCDAATGLMMPGGKSTEEIKDVQIIIPGKGGRA